MTLEKKKDWVSYIRNIYTLAATSESKETIPVFHPPASPELISECEKSLGVIFPEELKQLLFQTNGVSERVPTAKREIDAGYFLFSVEEILKKNTFLRTHFDDFAMPLDCLLFFANDGMGDYFGFAIAKGVVPHSRIYFWDHEDDSRQSIAPTLEYFIENWLIGKIKV